ncbi:MAG: hypothetical protein HC853_16840 [Anaerolineae bacterium]|nr:hypothetical protein [Anaerolineae bacterium]
MDGASTDTPSRIHWFTVRPGLNDQLATYMFALSHFLRGLGTPNTWQQLVADQGQVNLTYVLGLLRHDLAALADVPPLLILDEVDVLRRELNEHAQLLHLLDDLRGLVPMALIGQKLVIEPHQHFALNGLSVNETRLLLADAGMAQDADWQRLYETTRGNPAMLALLGTAPAKDFLRDLKLAPSMELLLDRIWRRLSAAEQHMLMALSVFQTHAPQDAWPDEQNTIEQLIAHHLVSEDLHGGIAPLPFVREFVLMRTPNEVQETFHLRAAAIREARGEYTLAAHHYLAAQQPALAIWVWFNHREQEVQRGHAQTARTMFRAISPSALAHEEDRRALALLRAELHKLQGHAQEMEDELRSASWPEEHAASAYVHEAQRGCAGNARAA